MQQSYMHDPIVKTLTLYFNQSLETKNTHRENLA